MEIRTGKTHAAVRNSARRPIPRPGAASQPAAPNATAEMAANVQKAGTRGASVSGATIQATGGGLTKYTLQSKVSEPGWSWKKAWRCRSRS